MSIRFAALAAATLAAGLGTAAAAAYICHRIATDGCDYTNDED